ncbi:MAG: hypothetical protein P4L67_00230 [Candidatus Pacebacteria bacterium]|nr:hypothetical protein [Candidatus Paceibacterota bacterium]
MEKGNEKGKKTWKKEERRGGDNDKEERHGGKGPGVRKQIRKFDGKKKHSFGGRKAKRL